MAIQNEGFLDFLAIEKPSLSPSQLSMLCRREATMQVEVQSIGGDI